MAIREVGTVQQRIEPQWFGHPIRTIDTPGFEGLRFIPLGAEMTLNQGIAIASELNGHVASARELAAYQAADPKYWNFVPYYEHLTSTAAIHTERDGQYTVSFDDEQGMNSLIARLPENYRVWSSHAIAKGVSAAMERARQQGRVATLGLESAITLSSKQVADNPIAKAVFGEVAAHYARLLEEEQLTIGTASTKELMSPGITPQPVDIAFVGLKTARGSSFLDTYHAGLPETRLRKGHILIVTTGYR